jgi:metallo-beta-lactamase superfamily protein
MAKTPKSVEVRSYQVGFGDCFLLSFVYSNTDTRHILIDFGTTGLPRSTPSQHMPIVAKAIAEVVGKGNRLTALVATHRHADHISGFATDAKTGKSGEIIKALRPRIVLQPWTENPKAPPNPLKIKKAVGGNKGFVARLTNMNRLAEDAQQLAASKPAWMSATARKELGFLGEENLANKSAVNNLIAMGKAGKAKFLKYGDDSGLGALLPGVKVRVLGPPDLTQSKAITKQRSKDRDQFWHFVKDAVPQVPQSGNGKSKKPTKPGPVVPKEARWFRDRLLSVTNQSLLEIVRQLDDQMNNTSLILLFEVGNKKLLFPGDAQFENWSYAMTEARQKKQNAQLIADVDFYKVGHHGSLNATPRQWLWEAFKKKKGRKLQTMMSTMPGKHGKTASKTEVPRRTLLRALEGGSRLKNTNKLKPKVLENLTIL